MKGNTLKEFIDDIYACGGPEKEFLYKGKKYMLQCENNPKTDLTEIYVFECFGNQKTIFRCEGKNITECADKFVKSVIIDNKTIYEAERDIEILFG